MEEKGSERKPEYNLFSVLACAPNRSAQHLIYIEYVYREYKEYKEYKQPLNRSLQSGDSVQILPRIEILLYTADEETLS